MDDATLVEQAKVDREAFGSLYERYVDKIYRYIYYRTGNEADAEDLTARVFFRALVHIERYEECGYPFSAWLYRIAHNLVANWHRDHSRHPVLTLEEMVSWQVKEKGPEAMIALLDDKEALLAAIRRLPADRRELLILKFVEQLTNAEIGTIMGRSEGAIKSLYHRTLVSLRQELKPAPPARRSLRSWWRRTTSSEQERD